MQFDSYTAAGAHIACWMVNNPAAAPAALAAVLASYDVHEPAVTGAQVRSLAPWTRQLRAVFEATSEAQRAERADALLVAADCRPRLVRHRAGLPFHLHYAPVQAGLAARVKALTAGGLWHRVPGHLAQRAAAVLLAALRQPGQRGQPPVPPPAGRPGRPAGLTMPLSWPRRWGTRRDPPGARPVTITIDAEPAGPVGPGIPGDFAGLSFERGPLNPDHLGVPGYLFSPANDSLVTLFRNVG